MIKLRENILNTVSIFKSNWNYDSSTAGYTVKLIHDLSKKEYLINLLINTNNAVYNSFDVEINNGTTGLTLTEYGFYTLKIFTNSEIIYMERVQFIKNDYKQYIDDTYITYDNNDDTYIIYKD